MLPVTGVTPVPAAAPEESSYDCVGVIYGPIVGIAWGRQSRAEVLAVHTSPGPARSRRPARAARAGVIALVVLAAVAAGTWAAVRGGPAHPARAAGAPATVPGGSFTRLDGRQVSLAALRGEPAVVWFVAGGCASCAVSIPAVGAHLAAFGAARTRVLVLGMYGAFGQGAAGTAQLAGFGRAAAGRAFPSPAWTWGLASEQLTAAFDPSGTPDAYYLLDAAGHVIYQNSVPVSTISALLAHLRAAAS